MDITLKRTLQDSNGAHGSLYQAETFLCYTEELPWKNNEPGESCIPLGVYSCTAHNSPNHPNTWEVNGVEGRSAILIHTGNTMKDTEGCILVGLIKGAQGVYSSVAALAHLHTILPDNFTLIVQGI